MKYLERINWLDNDPAFSYTKSLYTAMKAAGSPLTQPEAAARSGFAFRIWVHKELCPSAMSMFDWNLIRTGVELCGFEPIHITRLWHETEKETEQREKAHAAIKESIGNSTPVIAWDLTVPEWELIIGYDDERAVYKVLSIFGQQAELPYDKLGKREIPILSVTVLVHPNRINSLAAAHRVLQIAVDHARQREWMERPDYQDGLPAFKLWAEAMEIVTEDDFSSRYYIRTYACMRRYAADYLIVLADEISELVPAAEYYQTVGQHLDKALQLRNDSRFPDKDIIRQMQEHILLAGEAETYGISIIENYLEHIPQID